MGDFSARFHRPESGIHTVEGNLAGSRAAALTKKRQREQEAFEAKKRQIASDAAKSQSTMQDKFQGDSTLSHAEQEFRSKTVGLVTAEDFKRAQAEREKPKEQQLQHNDNNTLSEQQRSLQEKADKKAKKKKLKEKKKMMSTLSFAHDDDDEGMVLDETLEVAENKGLKDPNVDTSFLPDKQRDTFQEQERLRLEREWKERQDAMKEETLEIIYSYWDGSGHRRTVQCRKGDTIGEFLELVRKDLSREFREMQNVSSDALVYVKEDLIIPQDLTFYDLIATKARGKSGPLFHFDVHDDVRIGAIDTRVEKDESHPGKVVERRWYDRNKHIFPASRWEIFDPSKEYGSYTIHGREVNKQNK